MIAELEAAKQEKCSTIRSLVHITNKVCKPPNWWESRESTDGASKNHYATVLSGTTSRHVNLVTDAGISTWQNAKNLHPTLKAKHHDEA